jgi:hypothetical protein
MNNIFEWRVRVYWIGVWGWRVGIWWMSIYQRGREVGGRDAANEQLSKKAELEIRDTNDTYMEEDGADT